jgi:hypothetical protein
MNKNSQIIISSIKKGILHTSLEPIQKQIQVMINEFKEFGRSQTIFINGHPGSGVTTLINSLDIPNLTKIDCRIYATEKLASTLLLNLTSDTKISIENLLQQLGSTIIYFDHFDSLILSKRQFFLYSLFNAIQKNTVSILLILSASSLDPLSGLEKRVRSRFTPICFSLPQPSLDIAIEIIHLHLKEANWKSNVFDLPWKKTLEILFSHIPSYHTATSFLASVVSQSEDSIRKELLIQTQHENLNLKNPLRFVSDLSHTEISLVLAADYIEKHQLRKEFIFSELNLLIQSQLVEFRSIQKSNSVSTAFEKLVNSSIFIRAGKDNFRFFMPIYIEELSELIPLLPVDLIQWVSGWMK